MDTAIIITGFIGLSVGASAGIALCAYQLRKNIAAQAEEIDALNLNNLRLRGQCTELATQAHDAQEDVKRALDNVAKTEQKIKDILARVMPLSDEFFQLEEAHAATKRKLSAAKGQITKLRKAMGVEV